MGQEKSDRSDISGSKTHFKVVLLVRRMASSMQVVSSFGSYSCTLTLGIYTWARWSGSSSEVLSAFTVPLWGELGSRGSDYTWKVGENWFGLTYFAVIWGNERLFFALEVSFRLVCLRFSRVFLRHGSTQNLPATTIINNRLLKTLIRL